MRREVGGAGRSRGQGNQYQDLLCRKKIYFQQKDKKESFVAQMPEWAYFVVFICLLLAMLSKNLKQEKDTFNATIIDC